VILAESVERRSKLPPLSRRICSVPAVEKASVLVVGLNMPLSGSFKNEWVGAEAVPFVPLNTPLVSTSPDR